MLLQNMRIGKTAVLITILILLGTIVALPLFILADETGETDTQQFLPIVYNQADGATTPTATATNCPLATPEPFMIDPVTSPTSELSQTLTVRLGRGEWVRATGPAGTVTANDPDPDGFFRVTVPLAANQTNEILVEGKVELVGTPGETCVYGDYILSNTVSIIQETPTSTATATPTSTSVPQPADLVVGKPQLISTPPVVVYQPLTFEVPITNTGDLDVNTLFFVDLLFDPTPVHQVDSYTAVSSLAGGGTITLTITSTIGLANFIGDHQVTALVDSLDHVVEANETNNLSVPFEITIAEPAMTPNYTSTPTGGATISGVARAMLGGTFLVQERMRLSAIEEATGEVVAVTYSDENGFYQFDNLIEGVAYTVQGCITIDNIEYFGLRSGRIPSDQFANIFAIPGGCP